MFAKRRDFKIGPDLISRGLAAVRWPARAEILTSVDDAVQVIVDGAHNSSSAAALVSTLETLFPSPGRTVLIYAGSGGHDFAATAREFARLNPQVVVTRTRHPKAVDPHTVADALRRDNVAVAAITSDVKSALREARIIAAAGDVIVATGSLFVAAEVREALLSIAPELYPDLRGEMTTPYEKPVLISADQPGPDSNRPDAHRGAG